MSLNRNQNNSTGRSITKTEWLINQTKLISPSYRRTRQPVGHPEDAGGVVVGGAVVGGAVVGVAVGGAACDTQ